MRENGSNRMRRLCFWLTGLFALAAIACEQEPAAPPVRKNPEYKGTIVALGDSLTAGQGVSEDQAYPALLEAALAAGGNPYQVINAGISGETSSGALSRIEWVLTLDPDIVILETGANDGFRGIDPALIEKNIRATVQTLKRENVVVVLAGMRMVENLGPAYTAAFAGIYPRIADAEDLVFIPFFLEGVGGDPRYNQADGIHPTAEGYRRITDTVYPYVREAIRKLHTN